MSAFFAFTTAVSKTVINKNGRKRFSRIKKVDKDLCDLLAQKSGLDFKTEIQRKEQYYGEINDNLVFSFSFPNGTPEAAVTDVARCLSDQTSLAFLNDENIIFMSAKNISAKKYHTSYDLMKRGINRIESQEIRLAITSQSDGIIDSLPGLAPSPEVS